MLADVLAPYHLTEVTPAALASVPTDRLEQLRVDLTADAERIAAGEVDDRAVEALEALAIAVEAVDAVTAAAGDTPEPRRPLTLSRVNARRPARTQPRPSASRSTIVAAGGQPIAPATLFDAFVAAMRGQLHGGAPSLMAPDGRVLVASIEGNASWPRLGTDYVRNSALVAAALTEHVDSLVAAGGLCAPVEPLYSLPVDAVTDQPVRDSLVRFQADRGGISFVPPPSIGQGAAGVTVWTEANDQSPSSPTTKPTVTVTCAATEEVTVDAITASLRIGNLALRFNAEMAEQWLAVLLAAQAREAEERLLALIDSGSTAANAGQLLGTARDVLATLDRASAGYRDRQRMSADSWLQLIAPRWLRDQIRVDLARQAPGDSALAYTDAEIDRLFLARRIRPTWSLDAEAMTGTQGAGALVGWNSTVKLRLFAPGTWLYLDGGTLNLGYVRDVDLIATNEAIWFAESFGAAANIGTESLVITADVCPDGSTSLGVDINPCVSGS